jgi:hypothetical protein
MIGPLTVLCYWLGCLGCCGGGPLSVLLMFADSQLFLGY